MFCERNRTDRQLCNCRSVSIQFAIKLTCGDFVTTFAPLNLQPGKRKYLATQTSRSHQKGE